MATHRYTLLLEEKLTRATDEILRMTTNDLRDETTVAALFDKYQVTPPVLGFDPNRKSYLDNGTYRIMIPVVEGDMYPLEDLLEDRLLNRTLPRHRIAIRPGSREIWVEYGFNPLSASELHSFPRQIFDHLHTMVLQVITPEVQQVNTLLRQKMNAYIRDRKVQI